MLLENAKALLDKIKANEFEQFCLVEPKYYDKQNLTAAIEEIVNVTSCIAASIKSGKDVLTAINSYSAESTRYTHIKSIEYAALMDKDGIYIKLNKNATIENNKWYGFDVVFNNPTLGVPHIDIVPILRESDAQWLQECNTFSEFRSLLSSSEKVSKINDVVKTTLQQKLGKAEEELLTELAIFHKFYHNESGVGIEWHYESECILVDNKTSIPVEIESKFLRGIAVENTLRYTIDASPGRSTDKIPDKILGIGRIGNTPYIGPCFNSGKGMLKDCYSDMSQDQLISFFRSSHITETLLNTLYVDSTEDIDQPEVTRDLLATLKTTESIINTGVGFKNTGKTSAPREDGEQPSCIVITCSVCEDLSSTLVTLHGNTARASVHYIIDKVRDDIVIFENSTAKFARQYQEHNDLTQQAFYAGKSSWKGKPSVNKFGIGIMLINDMKSEFLPEQINRLKCLLQDIQSRYQSIDMKIDVVGLGEVAARHIAPGRHFPWHKLAECGFGQWVDTQDAEKSNILIPSEGDGVDISGIQNKLKQHGYGIEVTGNWDIETAKWFAKFNIRYGTSYKGSIDLSKYVNNLLEIYKEGDLGREAQMQENIDKGYFRHGDLVWTKASDLVIDNLNQSIQTETALAGDTAAIPNLDEMD